MAENRTHNKNFEFLQAQLDMLNLIEEHGLDASTLLDGIELGLDADAGKLLDVLDAIKVQIPSRPLG